MCSYKCTPLFLIFLIIAINCFNETFFIYTLNNYKNKSGKVLNTAIDHVEIQDLLSFSEELIKSFSSNLKKVPSELLKEKVKAQIIKASDNLELPNPDEELCEINYSELCPDNWVNFGDGITCLSPIDYKGPCKKKVSFENATPLSKYKFSVECDVSWPCVGSCIEDLSQRCPENWVLNGDVCIADKNYNGKCIRKKNFDNYSESEKTIWSNECEVNWPCYEKNYDFNALCPLNWKVTPDHKGCLAPDSYIGPCMNVLYLFDLKDIEKLSLVKKCNIEWPIHQKKEFNLNALCPIGWKLSNLEDGTCTAPLSYSGPCEQKISFENFSKEEKYEFSQKCDVQWPLVDEKFQNFDLPCPYNWVLVEEGENICVAPIEYQGPCENIFSFNNYTKEMKSAWSNACNTVFINGNANAIYELNKHRGSKMLMKKKIFGKSKKNSNNFGPSINNGPIGHKGSIYEGQVLNADDETDYFPNKNTLKYRNKVIEIEDIEDVRNRDENNFVLTDNKVKDLILLKESSNDEKLRAAIDETIKDLHGKYFKDSFFSFIELRKVVDLSNSSKLEEIDPFEKMVSSYKSERESKGEMHGASAGKSESEKRENSELVGSENSDSSERSGNETIYEDNINEIKNLYENYKIENGNFSYEGTCIEKDYEKCPLGWTKINNKECLAPKSYIRSMRKCSSILNIGNMVKNVYDVAHNMSFVTMDIEKRKKMEKECNFNFPCKECERDYVSINCPLGWTDNGSGNCKAPNDYPFYLKELCNNEVNFIYATPTFKKNWSYLCKSDWPCFSICEKNYGSICPLGYKLINERIEKNNENIYVCANEYWKDYNEHHFNDQTNRNLCHVIEIYNSTTLKKEIEKKCKVHWPCLNKCEANFYQACPYNWVLKDNTCIAPYYYNPPKGCENSFNILSFNIFDKYLFSIKCFAPWPCKNSCQQDWSSPCPHEWILQKKKINKNIRYMCKPSNTYKGICKQQYDLTDYTFLQKQDFSFRCSVKWPCGASLHYTPNWQKESIYNDNNFKKLNTLKFYNPYYSSYYMQYKNSFF